MIKPSRLTAVLVSALLASSAWAGGDSDPVRQKDEAPARVTPRASCPLTCAVVRVSTRCECPMGKTPVTIPS
jgi:hypothetical protein